MTKIIKDAFILFKGTYFAQFKWRPKGKNKRVLQLYVFYITFLIYGVYFSLSTTMSFILQGAEIAIIPALFSYGSLMPLAMNLLRAHGYLFESEDYEWMMTLPIHRKSVILSKMLTLYCVPLIMGGALIIPGSLFYIFTSGQYMLVFPFLLALFMAPMLSTIISVGISFLISLLPNQNIIRFISTFAMVALGVSLSNLDNEAPVASLIEKTLNQSYQLFPPTYLLAQGFIGKSWLYFILFIVITLLAVYLGIIIIDRNFVSFNEKQRKEKKNIQHSWTKEKPKSQLLALFQMEFNRWRLSMQYFINTVLGIFLLIIGSLVILFLGMEKILTVFNVLPYGEDILRMAPFLAPALFITSTPAYASISLEGAQAWILRTMPISRKTLIRGKKSLSYFLHGLGLIALVVALILRGGAHWLVSIGVIVVGVSFSYLMTTMALFLNNQMRDFEWTNEMEPVKQNIAMPIMIVLGSVIVTFGGLFAFFNIGSYAVLLAIVSLVCCVLGKIFDYFLYKYYYI